VERANVIFTTATKSALATPPPSRNSTKISPMVDFAATAAVRTLISAIPMMMPKRGIGPNVIRRPSYEMHCLKTNVLAKLLRILRNLHLYALSKIGKRKMESSSTNPSQARHQSKRAPRKERVPSRLNKPVRSVSGRSRSLSQTQRTGPRLPHVERRARSHQRWRKSAIASHF